MCQLLPFIVKYPSSLDKHLILVTESFILVTESNEAEISVPAITTLRRIFLRGGNFHQRSSFAAVHIPSKQSQVLVKKVVLTFDHIPHLRSILCGYPRGDLKLCSASIPFPVVVEPRLHSLPQN